MTCMMKKPMAFCTKRRERGASCQADDGDGGWGTVFKHKSSRRCGQGDICCVASSVDFLEMGLNRHAVFMSPICVSHLRGGHGLQVKKTSMPFILSTR